MVSRMEYDYYKNKDSIIPELIARIEAVAPTVFVGPFKKDIEVFVYLDEDGTEQIFIEIVVEKLEGFFVRSGIHASHLHKRFLKGGFDQYVRDGILVPLMTRLTHRAFLGSEGT